MGWASLPADGSVALSSGLASLWTSRMLFCVRGPCEDSMQASLQSGMIWGDVQVISIMAFSMSYLEWMIQDFHIINLVTQYKQLQNKWLWPTLKWFRVFLEHVWGRSHFLEMLEITLIENIDNEEEIQFGDDIKIEKWNKVDGSRNGIILVWSTDLQQRSQSLMLGWKKVFLIRSAEKLYIVLEKSEFWALSCIIMKMVTRSMKYIFLQECIHSFIYIRSRWNMSQSICRNVIRGSSHWEASQGPGNIRMWTWTVLNSYCGCDQQ